MIVFGMNPSDGQYLIRYHPGKLRSMTYKYGNEGNVFDFYYVNHSVA